MSNCRECGYDNHDVACTECGAWLDNQFEDEIAKLKRQRKRMQHKIREEFYRVNDDDPTWMKVGKKWRLPCRNCYRVAHPGKDCR